MARSLSLATYLAFARRQPVANAPEQSARPIGELVWVHCSEPPRARSAARLGQRLTRQRPGSSLLLTVSEAKSQAHVQNDKAISATLPSEHPHDVRRFLEHWQPDLMIWMGPWLRPSLIEEAYRRSIPSILLEADTPGVEKQLWRWSPEPTRATLERFSVILAVNEAATARLRRTLPNPGPVIKTSGKVQEDNPVLPCRDEYLEEVRVALGGRPVWLAAYVQPQELPVILAAYRKVLKLSHRMLLIVVPDKPVHVQNMREMIARSELRLAEWDDGIFPDDNTHVLLTETTDELGLWYRIAPITFMGASLVPGTGGYDPLEPASLGSAILYGPNVRRHLESFSRLAEAGGARIVNDAASLTAALTQLTAPDQVAAMAHAGWQVISEGAEITDEIVTLSHRLLDERETAA